MSGEELELTAFVKTVSREELGPDKCEPAAEEIWFHWRDTTSNRQWPSAIRSHVGMSENMELVAELICSHESALLTHNRRYKIEIETGISRSSVCPAH